MKAFWRKNNKKLDEILNEFTRISNSTCEDREEKLKALREQFIHEDIVSQVAWISVRSCKGIRCKDCYMFNICKTKNVADSIILANALVKQSCNDPKLKEILNG